MSEDNKQAAIDRGHRAKALLENPLLAECVEKLKATYVEALLKTAPGDVEGRERLYTAHGMVDQIYAHLRVLIGDGQIASQQLEKLKRRN